MLILLLSTHSCALFTDAVKPTQVVDLPQMAGKSLLEMTALLGPSYPSGICNSWDIPEGKISACYESGDDAKKMMESISYRFPPATVFAPRTAVSSPEEMATLVRIDLRDRKPDSAIQGGYAYRNLIVNGKAVNVFFDGGPETIVGVRVDLK